MKTKFLLILLMCFGMKSKAQITVLDTSSCIFQPGWLLPYIDSNYSICDTNFDVIIEPMPNNIFHKGKTIKFGNTDIRDTSCALFTDTAIAYPINNYSAFHFLLPPNPQGLFSYYLKFWHKYETDSLLDGCWLEFSSDSGNNWYPADSFLTYNFPNIYSFCNLYKSDGNFWSNDFDTLQNGRLAWSGSSNGWHYSALHFTFAMPINKKRNYQINAIRFVFQSDSISNNRAGWIISDFSKGWVSFLGSTNDFKSHNQLPVFPNPSSSGVFQISYPSAYVRGNLQVYNYFGKKIIEQALSTTIDLSAYSNGIYYYKAYFDGKAYSGVLNKN
nr:T9SS type A sorting domain-containing protein [Chitinophagaceae bacterium]